MTSQNLRLARRLSGVVVVATTVVLVGWYTGVGLLTSITPGFVSMKPNTALCLLLIALVPWIGQRHRGLAAAGAVAVLTIATTTAFELAFRARWWVDSLLPGIDLRGDSPQMAPMTAACLVALSVSAIAASQQWTRLHETTAALAVLAAYVALIGYLYGTSHLYSVGAYSSMALHTAVSIVLLGCALLAVVPAGGLLTIFRDPGPAGGMARSLVPFLVVAPPVLGWLRLIGQHRGWYDTSFGVAISTTALTCTSLVLLFRAARHVFTANSALQVTGAALAEANSDLERRVRERTADAHRIAGHFQAAFASSPIGSALVTTDGLIEQANDELLRLVGSDRAPLVGRGVEELFDDEHAAVERELRQALLSGAGGSYQLERRLRAGDEACWVLVHVALVKNDGEPGGLLYKLQDVSRRKVAEERAQFMALHDSLTTLPNRALLMDRITQSLEQAARNGRGVGLLFLDIDRFKTINDSLGHDVGDQVLREFGSRLQSATRSSDTVARLGGDEFVIVCPDIGSEHDVVQLANKLREVLSRPLDVRGQDVPLSASIGVAFGVGGDDAETLIRRADQAMYRAKEGGRARYEVFDDDLRTHINTRLDVELGLRGAVEREEIETWFQPIVDLPSGRPVATEALARWRRPQHGLVLPSDFIRVAEEVGLMKELGGDVLDRACLAMAQLPSALSVSVNVSAKQFVRGDFQARVETALALSGLDPGRLWLELTENAVVEAVDSAARSFQALRSAGVRIAIDDFGTGYSSFIQLRQFDVDLVKIDMTFTADLAHDTRDRELVGAMMSMAHSLGLQVIAEGIETAAQRDILLELGCDLGQGYLYAKPSPIAHPVVAPLLGIPAARHR